MEEIFTLPNTLIACLTFPKKKIPTSLVAGACSERKKMFLGGSFLKLADDKKYIKNPEAQNREVRGF